MKKLVIIALFAVLISGFNKARNTANEDPIPVADFRINTAVADLTVLEGSAIELVNDSRNCETYEWDFGNGLVPAERTPAGFVLRNCPRTQEIRLIVRTRH